MLTYAKCNECYFQYMKRNNWDGPVFLK